jgi:uncharacterized protein YuzE
MTGKPQFLAAQSIVNRRVAEDVVLDLGEDDRIVGIEILDASKHLNLEQLLPVSYEIVQTEVSET